MEEAITSGTSSSRNDKVTDRFFKRSIPPNRKRVNSSRPRRQARGTNSGASSQRRRGIVSRGNGRDQGSDADLSISTLRGLLQRVGILGIGSGLLGSEKNEMIASYSAGMETAR